VSVAGQYLDEGEVERLELIEAAARLLIAAWDGTRGLTFARQVVDLERLVEQLRSALEGRASSSSSPPPGGGHPAG
jgi:hypothetical protein